MTILDRFKITLNGVCLKINPLDKIILFNFPKIKAVIINAYVFLHLINEMIQIKMFLPVDERFVKTREASQTFGGLGWLVWVDVVQGVLLRRDSEFAIRNLRKTK